MEDESLPTNDEEGEVSDLSSVYDEDEFRNTYVVRFTPLGKYTFEQVVQWLKDYFQFWIIAVESLPQVHYHMVIDHDEGLKEMKELCRGFIYEKFGPEDRKRGFGNKQYNCQLAKPRTEENADMVSPAISYCLKDKEHYEYQGYEPDFIERCVQESFPKKSVESFKVELRNLLDKFAATRTMDVRDFMVEFCLLKAKYEQTVVPSHAYGFANSALIRRDGRGAAEDLVENYLYTV